MIGDILKSRQLFINMSSDIVTKIELAKVYMKLEESETLKKENKLKNVDDLFESEQILAGLAEENIFLQKDLERYTKFAK